jgi:hypothetical protein
METGRLKVYHALRSRPCSPHCHRRNLTEPTKRATHVSFLDLGRLDWYVCDVQTYGASIHCSPDDHTERPVQKPGWRDVETHYPVRFSHQQDRLQQALDTVIAIRFDALVLPATLSQRKEPKCTGGMDTSASDYSFAGHRHWDHPSTLFKDVEIVIEKINSGVWSLLLLGKHGTPER